METNDINRDIDLSELEKQLKSLINLHPKVLLDRDEKFRNILENIPALILVYDEEEKLIYANPNLEKITGYSLLEIYQNGFKTKIAEEDLEKFKRFMDKKFYSEPETLDFKFSDKSGHKKLFRGIFSNIPLDKNKNFILLLLIPMHEVLTKETEDKEYNSFKMLFENNPDIIIIHDTEGKIIDLNIAAISRLKYPKEEIIGNSLSYLGLQKNYITDLQKDSFGLSAIAKVVTRDGCGINVKIERCLIQEGDHPVFASIMKETSLFWLNKIENDHFERSISHIFHYLDLGFVFWDSDGNILRISSNCEQITGIELNFWNISEPYLENLIEKEDFMRLTELIPKALSGVIIKDISLQFIYQEKPARKVRAGLLPILDDQFNNCKLILTVQDYNSEKKDLNGFYKLLVNSAPVGIITFNKEGKYTSVNEEFLKMLAYEYDRETVLSWNIYDLVDKDKILPGFVKALEGEFVGYIRDYMPTPSAQKFSFYQVFAPLKDEKGEIIGVLGLLNEITDNSIIPQNFLESEEKYRKVFENLEDIYIIHNPAGKINCFNQKVIDSLGYSSGEFVKMNFMNLFADEESEEIEDRIFELHSFGKMELDTEILNKEKNRIRVHISGKGIEISGLQYFLEIIKILPN